jgi:hypothetical protein
VVGQLPPEKFAYAFFVANRYFPCPTLMLCSLPTSAIAAATSASSHIQWTPRIDTENAMLDAAAAALAWFPPCCLTLSSMPARGRGGEGQRNSPFSSSLPLIFSTALPPSLPPSLPSLIFSGWLWREILHLYLKEEWERKADDANGRIHRGHTLVERRRRSAQRHDLCGVGTFVQVHVAQGPGLCPRNMCGDGHDDNARHGPQAIKQLTDDLLRRIGVEVPDRETRHGEY